MMLRLLFLTTGLCWAIVVRSAASFLVPEFRGDCRFFLDTASEREFQELLSTGLFHGVVINPPVLLREKNQPCTVENLHRLADLTLQLHSVAEFMCQSWGSTADELYATGMALSAPDRDRIVVKVPVTLVGVQAATQLIRAGRRVCLTAAYNPKQALIAASIGAEYLAPCLGLMNDAGKDGVKECVEMMRVVRGLSSRTRIMVACIRDVELLTQLARAGLQNFAFSPSIARQLFDEPLTDNTASFFEQAVEMTNQKAMLPLTTEYDPSKRDYEEILPKQPSMRRPETATTPTALNTETEINGNSSMFSMPQTEN